jgi:prophage antirepressor-like protein
VTMKQLAQGMGYSNNKALTDMINRNQSEFDGKVSVIKLMTIKGERDSMVINYHGVIRAAMLSDAPRAVAHGD